MLSELVAMRESTSWFLRIVADTLTPFVCRRNVFPVVLSPRTSNKSRIISFTAFALSSEVRNILLKSIKCNLRPEPVQLEAAGF